MREIKFRAWHHGGGDPRVPNCMGYSEPFKAIFWTSVEREVHSVEVMQYTGLKDKNGVEIWEGDIIQYTHRTGQRVGVVAWDKYMFAIDGFWASWQDNPEDAFGEDACLEIVGNIHENPELLEDKE